MDLFSKQRVAVKNTEFSILSSKDDDSKNVKIIEIFIRYLNEKLANGLREMDIIDRTWIIIEVTKMIQRKAVRDRFLVMIWADLGSIYTTHQKKPSIIGPFSNDLQPRHGVTRSDYGRMQNQVSTALEDDVMWCFYVFLFLTFLNYFPSFI